MAEMEPVAATCPSCRSQNVRAVGRKDNLRPRPHTGNLQADLRPVSATVTYKCQDQGCGHEWSETIPR